MRIAVIGAKGLPPLQGGIEHYCAELYPRMVNRGCTVDLFARASYTGTKWGQRYQYKGVNVIPLPGLKMRGVDAFVTSALGAVASSTSHYDIIHFHALGPSLFTCLPRVASSSKIVVTCQGLDWQRAKWGSFSSRLIQMGEQAAVKFADGIIVVSNALQTYFQRTYSRQTVYIPNAPASYADSDSEFDYGKKLGLEKGRYILFLGRIVPEKRPDLLIEAFSKLQQTGWKLVLAGGVSDTKDYTAEILDKISTNPDIIFAGELQGVRLAEIVRGAGLFALPSDLEGLPLAMLEAMREGIPVVASDIAPHQQLVTGRGILFEAGNVDSCMQSLAWSIQNPQECAKMAKNAQIYLHNNYSWDRITSDTMRLYTKLLNSPLSKDALESDKRESGLAGVTGKE
ncbi:putative glycosyl transferase [Calothrix sp. NIES-4071]|nr:putative glycosyl transferase [Calothrix sp. NIES-4071]BAZ56371.1 putative glycosyl transferase [Calothrix sp. NIES-4105]